MVPNGLTTHRYQVFSHVQFSRICLLQPKIKWKTRQARYMNYIMDDKVIANVIKGLPKADWKEREKVANALDAYILKRSIDAPLRDLLRTSLSLLSNFRHESKRRPVEEYERLIKTLLDLGYSQVASAIFSNCYSSISPLLEDSMMAIIPTVKDVNLWIKESNADKKKLAEGIYRDPDCYYDSILFDWACKVLPIATARPLIQKVLSNDERGIYLAQTTELLATLLDRDKNGFFSKELISSNAKSQQKLQMVVTAIAELPSAWGRWSSAIADYLIESEGYQDVSELVAVIEKHSDRADKDAARFSAHFPAHLLTTISITEKTQPQGEDQRKREIIDRLVELTLKTHAIHGDQVWVAGPAQAITGFLMEGESTITLHGARHVAQGLRALESNPNSSEVFRAVAKNLGLVEIDNRGETVDYDPLRHEDLAGGVLPGDAVTVICTGWSFDNSIVLKAQVRK
jgi:hypothetical protein